MSTASSRRTERQLIGAYGAHVSWANTPDRTARTANGRAAGPAELAWHVARLDPVRFADASDEQRRVAAEAARKAYFTEIAHASWRARRGHRESG